MSATKSVAPAASPGSGAESAGIGRLRVNIRGAVQGVGFRPHVFRLASALAVSGWVANSGEGVVLEIEGPRRALKDFLEALARNAPAAARLASITTRPIGTIGEAQFGIRPSMASGPLSTRMLPDLAMCEDCRTEIFDPANRRHGYPFTTCTACGPRYSVQTALPYDRLNTSLAGFTLCGACAAEYADPGDRRFHHQTNACPACGPQLRLLGPAGETLAARGTALDRAVAMLRAGACVAVQGIGGFHLCVDASDSAALIRLRAAKARPAKPFALMVADLEAARALCHVGHDEALALAGPAAPIVILRRRAEPAAVAAEVAPDTPWLGVMLAATPLHALLVDALGRALVATSGNRGGELLCSDEAEARAKLGATAAAFLVHDRRIVRRCDDSVLRIAAARPLLLRRARGFVPDALACAVALAPTLAVGGHLKTSVARTHGRTIEVSAHVGDLDCESVRSALADTARAWSTPHAAVACDMHPDYASRAIAYELASKPIEVQHHLAHAAAVLAEHRIDDPVLAAVWDGAGYGTDGVVWGGEFLRIDGRRARRVGCFDRFHLPGGERAMREPRRTALSLLAALEDAALLDEARLPTIAGIDPDARAVLLRMLERSINTVPTTSVGRLFDGIASLAGLAQITSFEGQAAIALEGAALGEAAVTAYPYALRPAEDDAAFTRVDWRPLIRAVVENVCEGAGAACIAARFHATLAEILARVAARTDVRGVILAGGCFQNVRLLEACIDALVATGLPVYWPRALPPNDGALALGQAYAAARGMTLEA